MGDFGVFFVEILSGYPFLISLPGNVVSYDDLNELVWKRLRYFMKDPASVPSYAYELKILDTLEKSSTKIEVGDVQLHSKTKLQVDWSNSFFKTMFDDKRTKVITENTPTGIFLYKITGNTNA